MSFIEREGRSNAPEVVSAPLRPAAHDLFTPRPVGVPRISHPGGVGLVRVIGGELGAVLRFEKGGGDFVVGGPENRDGFRS